MTRRRPQALHQFLTGATSGDAITDQALMLRDWLRELDFDSHLYAEHIHESVGAEVRPLAAYRHPRGEEWAIYHHSTGSGVASFLRERGPRLILIYHNVTPARFFTAVDPAWVGRSRQGEEQLQELRPQVELALGDSAYNRRQLEAAGYEECAVLPITLSEEQLQGASNPTLAARLEERGPLLLFVGRLAPNKRQEDLVKLLYAYRRIRPRAHLALVGDRWTVGYDGWIEHMAGDLGLDDAVLLTGKVSQQDMLTYYRHADVYVSMSEHEGFGKPLIESMYLGLPVMAYASAAVPDTIGDASVLFHRKDYEQLAELVDLLVTDRALRERLIERQRKRVRAFLPAQVKAQFLNFLTTLDLIADET